MKHIITLLSVFALTCFVSCNSPNQQNQAETTSGEKSKSEQNNINNGIIQFQRTKVGKERDTISFNLPHAAYVVITLKTPSNTGNLRINQLIMPDGTMDGPYGRVIKDTLSQIGNYQIIVGESLMQGDTYAGDYNVKIKID